MTKKRRHSFSRMRHFHGRKPYRHYSKDRGRKRSFITSLKVWLPVFCFILFILTYFEASAPMKFYEQVPLVVRFPLYLLTIFVALLTGYKIFLKLDYEPRTERGIFALRLLSGVYLLHHSYSCCLVFLLSLLQHF